MSLILFLIFFISHALSSSIIIDYTHVREEPLGCLYNTTHSRYYYEIPPNSSIRFPTCRNPQSNSTVYWFSYSEYCRNGFNRNRHFATVFPNGTSTCENRLASPTLDDCRQNYLFNFDWTILVKTDQESISEYVCSNSRTVSMSERSVRYSIRFQMITVDDPSTSTFSSLPTISTESNTNDTSTFFSTATADPFTESESKSPLLIIIVSASAAFLTITLITGSIIGYIYYRRRRVQQEQKAMQMECLK